MPLVLFQAFSQYGEIEEGAVIIDKATGKSRGFGFITYKQTDAAHRALREPSKRIDVRVSSSSLFLFQSEFQEIGLDVNCG